MGNANRFDSEEQCERQCGQFKDQGKCFLNFFSCFYNAITNTNKIVDVCILPYDVGPCQGQFHKWFYDTANGVCREFVYGGCGGNGNRFSSLRECETICFHREEALPVTNDTILPHHGKF